MYDNTGWNPLFGGQQPVPQGMLDVWSWKHMKLVKKFNQAEIVLQNYSKL